MKINYKISGISTTNCIDFVNEAPMLKTLPSIITGFFLCCMKIR